MINLLPWREQLFFKRKILALSLIAIGYLLLFVVSGIFFFKTYDKRNEWISSIQQLHQEAKQLQLHSKDTFDKEITQKQLLTMRAVVWKRYEFIKKTIQLMIRVPYSVVLSKIDCMKGSCAMELNAKTLQIANLLFSNDQVQDVKQGICPLCYQVEVTSQL